MNPQKLTADLDSLKARVGNLEDQVLDMRKVISVLLEALEIGKNEKDGLFSTLEVKAVEEAIEAPRKKVYDKTIQQLIEESEGRSPGKAI